jgi:pullulanase
LMAALLFMSLGVPMLGSGQDFLRSKRGVNNTYLRGDLNALDYRRLHRHLSTHAYFVDWIAFRRSELGRLLRQWSRPSEGFFQFFHAPNSPALAVLCNADGSQGTARLLFAVNPIPHDVGVALSEDVVTWGTERGGWVQLADQDRFFDPKRHRAHAPVEKEILLPGLSCRLWVCGG